MFKKKQYQVIPTNVESGNFGNVYQATDRNSNTLVAVKQVKLNRARALNLSQETLLQRTKAEKDVLEKLKEHQNIVKLLDWYQDEPSAPNSLYIVMEYCGERNLSQYMSGALSESKAQGFAQQIRNGLWHLHTEGVVHRDLKPANIMLDERGNEVTLKIVDFGTSKMNKEEIGTSSGFSTLAGSECFMAPEILNESKESYGDNGIVLLMLFFAYSFHFVSVDCALRYHSVMPKFHCVSLSLSRPLVVRCHNI